MGTRNQNTGLNPFGVREVSKLKEMIAAKHKYGVVQGCERSTSNQFHSVLPASNKEPNAVGLKRWLKTYQAAKPKASKS